jgi:hypothetical protein
MADEPDIFTKINFIIQFWLDPCDAPWTAYAETALPAALEALATYFALDWKQIFTSYVRPAKAMGMARRRQKGGSNNKRGRPGQRGRNRGMRPYDPNDTLGKSMPGAERLRGRKITGALIHLWIIEGLIERLLFWIFFVELVAQFLYRWASLMFESRFCQALDDAVLLKEGGTYTEGAGSDWQILVVDTVRKVRGNITHNLGVVTPGDGISGTLMASCTFTHQPDWPNAVAHFRIIDLTLGVVLTSSEGPGEGLSSDAALKVPANSNHTYAAQVLILPTGYMLVSEATLYFQGSNT